MFSSPDKRVFIAVHEKWFAAYITERLGRVADFYNVEVTDDNSSIGLLNHNE